MRLAILGTHGIPARHGGFETFAERLALHLAQRGWKITVYCPELGGSGIRESAWRGIRLLHLPVRRDDAVGTILFDWRSTLQATREGVPVLNLGYGTALFGVLYRLAGTANLINMDGIEWRREKWSFAERSWLYLNERAGCLLGSHLIADHPEIERHLATRVSGRKITMIPYGADLVTGADPALLAPFGLTPGGYAIGVARPDPDNSLLEIVAAFSAKRRGMKLVILGKYTPDSVPYHREVLAAAGDEVLFPGAIYDSAVLQSLRFHARLYLHGHRVGGTNPSLVEALAAGSPVLAHDNPFNRWVAGAAARYFGDRQGCERELDALLQDDAKLAGMRREALKRHGEEFTWEKILGAYEELLRQKLPVARAEPLDPDQRELKKQPRFPRAQTRAKQRSRMIGVRRP